MPPIPGFDLDGVYAVVKDVEYLTGLQQRLESSKDVVIIGGGLVGGSLACALGSAGLKVCLIEAVAEAVRVALVP